MEAAGSIADERWAPTDALFKFSRENPDVGNAGRSNRTLSESITVALAVSRCAFRLGRCKNHSVLCARGHIRETSKPNEAILMIKVSKLTDDFYPGFLLGFDKFAIKETSHFPG